MGSTSNWIYPVTWKCYLQFVVYTVEKNHFLKKKLVGGGDSNQNDIISYLPDSIVVSMVFIYVILHYDLEGASALPASFRHL